MTTCGLCQKELVDGRCPSNCWGDAPKGFLARVVKRTETVRDLEYSDAKEKGAIFAMFIVSIIAIFTVWIILNPETFAERATTIAMMIAAFLSLNFYRARVLREKTTVEERI